MGFSSGCQHFSGWVSGWALIKKNTVYVNSWWVGTSKEYRRKWNMDMIGMIPHYFVYKDLQPPWLHDTCTSKQVAYDLWTGMKIRVIYESETRWDTGLGSIPFFQFNSNSVIFNSNSNSNSTTHNKFQFQFQFRRFQFQFQFQFRIFKIPAISILEMTCWCLPWNWL